MKKTIKLAVVAAMALGATSAFATNGSTLIGLGAKSRGMAGTAIGVGHGAESALSNPALITTIKKDHEISFGGTLFMPNVKNTNGQENSSDADLSVIPEVSLATKVNDNFYWGVGMWGTAGMGTDYRTNDAQLDMVTNLQLMQFGVPLAYTTNGLSIAVAPILQYGSLDINYRMDTNQDGALDATSNTLGVAQDLQFGYSLGISYEVSNFTVGAVYKSQIDMEYKGQLSKAMADFGVTYNNDKLSTPAELGIGVSYVMGEHTIALDYKQIKWSSAKGYEDFQWDDQNVFALGYAYTTKDWAVRLGYNYAKSPISEQANVGTIPGRPYTMGALINMLNLLGFPAIVESHYAIGGSYTISDTTSVDAAFTYAPEVTETYQITNLTAAPSQTMTTKHSQTALTLQLNYAF